MPGTCREMPFFGEARHMPFVPCSMRPSASCGGQDAPPVSSSRAGQRLPNEPGRRQDNYAPLAPFLQSLQDIGLGRPSRPSIWLSACATGLCVLDTRPAPRAASSAGPDLREPPQKARFGRSPARHARIGPKKIFFRFCPHGVGPPFAQDSTAEAKRPAFHQTQNLRNSTA